MVVRYSELTDTLYIEFNQREVVETQEINENTYLDLDAEGNIVAMTLEHAQSITNVWEFSFQHARIPQPA
jgi:uncharacterized protein YuzE